MHNRLILLLLVTAPLCILNFLKQPGIKIISKALVVYSNIIHVVLKVLPELFNDVILQIGKGVYEQYGQLTGG